MKTFWVYCIEVNDVPVYVGFTRNITQRAKDHKFRFGKDLKVVELEHITPQRGGLQLASNLERYWIHQFIAWGFKLQNISKIG